MTSTRPARVALLWVEGFVAVTALAGGAALAVGSLMPELDLVITPPAEYLDGSPFTSYLLPGLALGLVLGGVHALAFVLLLRRRPAALFAGAAAGYAALIWIFVQMTVIPFSVLQAVYFAAGAIELGLVLLVLGLLPIGSSRRRSERSESSANA
ncbi:hypothetical protein [Ruicaihuangia caeni]|uniref:hypothetical protein n=1 Tax=Ruicaihuangia caeni TaxID=3042517 RepID=UPI00338F9FE0